MIDMESKAKSISMSMVLTSANEATMQYAADHDEVLPAATSMPTIRALVQPYTDSMPVFEFYSPAPSFAQFNFNLAGVSTSLPPFPGTRQTNAYQVVTWHSQLPMGPRRVAIVTFDGKPKVLEPDEREKFQRLLAPQFDRKGVKLFPPDYLADKDPLKENP